MNTPSRLSYSLDEHEPRWFAVYTRYKREKLIRERLQEQGVETYLPLQQLTRRSHRRMRGVELPLISCSIFTRITKNQCIPVPGTSDVLDFVRLSRRLIAIPEEENFLIERRHAGYFLRRQVDPALLKKTGGGRCRA